MGDAHHRFLDFINNHILPEHNTAVATAEVVASSAHKWSGGKFVEAQKNRLQPPLCSRWAIFGDIANDLVKVSRRSSSE